jgi:class 3 adenylate cyclase
VTRRVWQNRYVSTLTARWNALVDQLSWNGARAAVDAVRYQPRQLDLVLACGARQPDVPEPVVRWLVDARNRPSLRSASALPHALVRLIAAEAARWLGPTASAVVRWGSGAAAAAADYAGASTLQQPFRARAHPGMLVPHPHLVAVLALDMRGFSHLTGVLHDTQYLADLIGEYLSAMTEVIERHRGVVFQYTGDGLLALFLPELAGTDAAAMLDRLVQNAARELHGQFDALNERWRADWKTSGRAGAAIGLGIGVSFGRATIGLLGPSGKKQFGVIGEPVNQAAFLCSQAPAGHVLVERDAFVRAGGAPPAEPIMRLRSKKRHQRIDAIRYRYGAAAPRTWSGRPSSFTI